MDVEVVLTEALNAARSAQDRFTILISLYDLALSSQAQGDLTGAAERLQEGVSQSAEAGDEPSVAYYLEALAAVATRQDNLERAVRLLAAAGALLQAKGSGWLHALVPRAAHDDDLLDVLRSRMGDAAFEQACRLTSSATHSALRGRPACPAWRPAGCRPGAGSDCSRAMPPSPCSSAG